MKYLLSSILALLITNAADSATLYRWVDKDGRVHYGDKPASDAVNAERRKISISESADDEDDLPYSVRKAKEDFPVTLYMPKNCNELCDQATTYLNNRGIPYAEKIISSNKEADELKKQDGVTGLPALKVGRTILNGYDDQLWGNELNLAGYPKTKPVGMRLKKKEQPKDESASSTENPAAENQQPAISTETPQ